MTNTEKERIIEERKYGLRNESRLLDFSCGICRDFSHNAKIFLREQNEERPLRKQESSSNLLKRLDELCEAAKSLSNEFDALSTLKLKEADSLTLANFEESKS